MHINIICVTGKPFSVFTEALSSVATLKHRIFLQTGVPAEQQSLIFGDKVLADQNSLLHCGVCENASLRLILLPRCGPVDITIVDRQVVSEDTTEGPLCSVSPENVAEGIEGYLLDLSFTEEKRIAAKQKAHEDIRTYRKMQELKRNIERANFEKAKLKKKCGDGIVGEKDGGKNEIRLRKVSGSRVKGKLCRSSYPPSAPEDTSAKESSAGETEYEESTAGYDSRQATTGVKFRHRSSSSDLDSSVAILTSDAELYTAEENYEFEPNFYRWSDKGGSDCSLHNSWRKRTTTSDNEAYESASNNAFDIVDALETHSDPSELSSGFVICELSMLRRPKVKRKTRTNPAKLEECEFSENSAMSADAGIQKSFDESDFFTPVSAFFPRPGKPKHSTSGAVSNSPSLYRVGRASGSFARKTKQLKQNGKSRTLLSTGSSSEEPDSQIIECATYPNLADNFNYSKLSVGLSKRLGLGNYSNSHYSRKIVHVYPYRKITGGNAGSSHGKMSANSSEVVRNHRLPQSSQSQQRCNSCGFKLSIANSFHCRCGKTLCSKHKSGDAHCCSYDYNKSDGSRKVSAKTEITKGLRANS